MPLATTYYDVLIKRDPEMLALVRQDIKLLGNIEEPFSSTDDYSKYFEEYLGTTSIKATDDILLMLHSMGITDKIEVENFKRQFHSSSEFKNLLYSKHADYLTLTNFEMFGKKTFHISSNLVEHLAQTNLEVDSGFVRPPFETCLFMYSSETAIRAFYAINEHHEKIDLTTPISVFVHSLPAKEGTRKILFACWHSNHKKSYSFVKRELLIRDGWSVSKTLKTDWGDIYSENGEPEEVTFNESFFGKKEDDKVFYEKGLMFFRILINTILYLSSNEPDIIQNLSNFSELENKLSVSKAKSKIKKWKKQIAQTSKLNYSEVGENLPPIIVERKTNETSSSGLGKGNTIEKRFIVRGHWRNQSCGINQQSRKIIWIKPYYKGLEMAELINKQYIVK